MVEIVNQKDKSKFMEEKGGVFKDLCENISSLRKLICRFEGNGTGENESYKIGLKKSMKYMNVLFQKIRYIRENWMYPVI